MATRMRLRSSIRAPARYGEASEAETPTTALLQSMRQTRAQSTGAPQAVGLGGRLNVQAQVVEFDSTLPPAAFPSLKQPRPLRVNALHGILRNGMDDLDSYQAFKDVNKIQPISDLKNNDVDGCALGHISLDNIENYAASNTELNPIYVRNMAMTASQHDLQRPYPVEFEDSDLDEPKDASEALGEKIPNPSWHDISPSLQVEIVENMMKTGKTWRTICTELEIQKDNRDKLRRFLHTRNQQIERENKQLRKMRDNQLQALMRIDNSDIKSNNVPHQLVLRRWTRKAFGVILRSSSPDLLHCQAADLLTARQYLHRRALPRSLSGDWGHSLVVLQSPDDDSDIEQEKFEWNNDLHEASKLSEEKIRRLGHGKSPIVKTKRGFIYVAASKGNVNPHDLTLPSGHSNEQPVVDWGRYFPDWRQQDEARADIPRRRTDGIVTLKIGAKGAAQIRDWEAHKDNFGFSPPRLTSIPLTPPLTKSPNQFSSPAVGLEDTPSKIPVKSHPWSRRLIELSNHPVESFRGEGSIKRPFSLLTPRRPERPVKRMLGGPWSMSAVREQDPAIGQARYTQQIQEARLEAAWLKAKLGFRHEIQQAERACVEEAQKETPPFDLRTSPTVSSFPVGVFTCEMPYLPELEDVLFSNPNPSFCDELAGASVSMCDMDDLVSEFVTQEYVDALQFMEEDWDPVIGHWKDEVMSVAMPARANAW